MAMEDWFEKKSFFFFFFSFLKYSQFIFIFIFQTNWWTNQSSMNFETQAQCVIDTYDQYEVLPGQFINGRLTAGESLADLGGLRIAFKAYKNWVNKFGEAYSDEDLQTYFPGFTNDQLFFVSFAQVWCSIETDAFKSWLSQNDPHPLARYRAIGATSNFDQFWKRFEE